jgi:hypothetical protein
MMNNHLPALLAELAETAPDVCWKNGTDYIIEPYRFGFANSGGLMAHYQHWITDQPALAWLQCALQAECRRRNWHYQSGWTHSDGVFFWAFVDTKYIGHANSEAEALLLAFIAAVKGEK